MSIEDILTDLGSTAGGITTTESVFAHGLGYHVLWVGLLMGGIVLGVQPFSMEINGGHWQTMVFTVLCLTQLGHVLAIRSETQSLFSQDLFSNKPLLLAVIPAFVLQMAMQGRGEQVWPIRIHCRGCRDAITYLAQIAQWAMIFGGRSKDEEGDGGTPIATIAMMIVAPIAAMLIQMAISRSREYGADAGGAGFSGNPLFLANALRKLQIASQRMPMEAAPATAHMFIVNPLRAAACFASSALILQWKKGLEGLKRWFTQKVLVGREEEITVPRYGLNHGDEQVRTVGLRKVVVRPRVEAFYHIFRPDK